MNKWRRSGGFIIGWWRSVVSDAVYAAWNKGGFSFWLLRFPFALGVLVMAPQPPAGPPLVAYARSRKLDRNIEY
jgi:hypothetical protein